MTDARNGRTLRTIDRRGPQKSDILFLTPLDLADPDVVKAARFLEGEKVCRVARLGDGQPTPPDYVLVVPKEKLENHQVWLALEKIVRPGIVVRADNEVPTGTEESARTRGFTEDEIREHLRPWVAQGKTEAAKTVAAAEKALEQARTEAAEAVAQIEARETAGGDVASVPGAGQPTLHGGVA